MKKIFLQLSLLCLLTFSLSAKSVRVFSTEKYECIRTQIDIEEYLNNGILARREKELKTDYNGSILGGFAALFGVIATTAENNTNYRYYEMDVDAVVKYQKESYNIQKCIAVSATNSAEAKKLIKESAVPKIFSALYQIPSENAKEIKVSSIKYTEINQTKNKDWNQRNDIFVNDISNEENVVWEFSADITYQTKELKKEFERAEFENATVVFQSSLSTIGIAVFDFQIELWEYAKEHGYKKTPYPTINNITAYRLEYVPKAIPETIKTEKTESSEQKKAASKKEKSENSDKSSGDNSDELQILIDMYKKGLIDDEEFLNAKKRLQKN